MGWVMRKVRERKRRRWVGSEEGMGDGRGDFEGRCVDVVDDGVDEFLGEGGNHGWSGEAHDRPMIKR